MQLRYQKYYLYVFACDPTKLYFNEQNKTLPKKIFVFFFYLEHGKSITRIPVVNTNGNADVHASSFHQQVDYLLTSKERSILKKTLLLYAEDRYIISNIFIFCFRLK